MTLLMIYMLLLMLADIISFKIPSHAMSSSKTFESLKSSCFEDFQIMFLHENSLKFVKKILVSSLCIMPQFLCSQDVYAVSREPTDKDNQLVQIAFRDFDLKRFEESDKEFSLSIERWKELDRPRDEIVSLLKARANVRVDNKQFEMAIQDYDKALEMMKVDGENADGTAKYPEYPDTFVGRALAREGLADWEGALIDYNKAIDLWGGGRSEGVNPYVLTFRGNTLSRLSKYEDAIPDYEAASDIFNSMRDIDRYADARANLALALYQVGRKEEALKSMNDVIRKKPGYVDMHVALAADEWSEGNYIAAIKEWNFACDRVDVGCKAYQDMNWVTTIRRWPPSLADKLGQFIRREIPDALKGKPGEVLAPAPLPKSQ